MHAVSVTSCGCTCSTLHILHPTQEEVHGGLTNKQPKIVVACLELLTAALKEFGAKVMDVKKLMKTIPAQLEHKDKNVREAAKGLAVEMYRWLGPVLKTSLEGSLKPVQVRMREVELQ